MTTGMQAVLMWAVLFIAGFLGHLIGDYLVQNGWMAANKAKPFFRPFTCLHDGPGDGAFEREARTAFKAICLHAGSWGLSVQLTMGLVAYVVWGWHGAILTAAACGVLTIIHWIQDRRWPIIAFMKATGKDHTQMWLLIVVDNVWHLVEIALAAALIVWRMTT